MSTERNGDSAAAVHERTEDDPSCALAAPVDIERLHGQLHEKEQLVAALTDRLEQAAEQLDRLRRTGVDKGRRPLVGGFPAELAEEHKSTLEDLKRVITRWEDMQADLALGRIETQIGELRDLVASNGLPPVTINPASRAASVDRRVEPADSKAAEKQSPQSWWEKQKAELMRESGEMVAESPASTPQQPVDAPDEPTESPAGSNVDLAQSNIPDLPAAVDFDNLTLDDARQALHERDRIIQQLREPLLLLKAAGTLPRNLQSLDEVPQVLRKQIAELEAQWQAKFRQAELDLSLERARLAREQSALHQQQEQVQKQARQAGRRARDHSDKGDKGDDTAAGRRWFRFMGKNSDGASDDSKS